MQGRFEQSVPGSAISTLLDEEFDEVVVSEFRGDVQG